MTPHNPTTRNPMKTYKNTPLMIAALILGTALSLVLGASALAATGLAVAAGGLAPHVQPVFHRMAAHNPEGSLGMAVTNLGNILWGDGDDNMGGIRTIAYYCLHSEVARGGHAAPVARASATTLAQLGSISADHTFKSGKGWKRMYTTEDAGMLDSTMQGEKDGRSWVNKIKITHPGTKEDVIGFMRLVQNAGTYWLAQDAEGRLRMVGSEFYPAKVETANLSTGETAAARKATVFEVTCSSPFPAPVCTFTPDIEDDDSSY